MIALAALALVLLQAVTIMAIVMALQWWADRR